MDENLEKIGPGKIPEKNDVAGEGAGEENGSKEIKKQPFLIRPLRTYEEDVTNFVKNEKVSTSKIVAAEQKRREQKGGGTVADYAAEQKKSYLIIKISVGLIGFGIIVAAGAFGITRLWNFQTDDSVRMSDFRDVLIDKKENVQISIENKIQIEIKNQIINSLKNPPVLISGEIAEIQIVRNQTFDLGNNRTADGIEKISVAELFGFMELRPPDSLVRSLGENYLIGMIGTREKTVPFILLRVADFERVYAGMLEWETTSLYRDVNDIFYETLGTNDLLVVTGGTEESNDPLFFNPNNLIDIIIFNRDARAIINKRGDILFFYTFVNSGHLLMTTSRQVVEDVARKLNLQNVVR